MKSKLAIVVIAFASCAPVVPTPLPTLAAVAPPPMISELPVSMTVKQRSTSSIPGSKEKLAVTIDDITRDQVMVTVIGEEGRPLLGPVSMKSGDSNAFQIGNAGYSLQVTELNNALIGEDFATVLIADESSRSLTEAEKIERLIAAVESMTDGVFIRNGQEYSAKDAADHLRTKLDAADGKLVTAEQFIEHVASKSSLTGEVYQIRLEGGDTIPAGDFLRDELNKLESARVNH